MSGAPRTRFLPAIDALTAHGHGLASVIESAAEVRHRPQFFVWAQSYLQVLVPHQLTVCGAYQRDRKALALEAFNSVALSPLLLASVTDPGSALMQQLTAAWIERRGRLLVQDLRALEGAALGTLRAGFLAAGFEELLVHGVARPQRASEIESLFILGAPGCRSTEAQQRSFDLLLPQMHSTWLRVQATELDIAARSGAMLRATGARPLISPREGEVLRWMREGKSNREIGARLGIGVPTVKNHVQKILHKLGAANRAQAVARAMTLNLLAAADPES